LRAHKTDFLRTVYTMALYEDITPEEWEMRKYWCEGSWSRDEWRVRVWNDPYSMSTRRVYAELYLCDVYGLCASTPHGSYSRIRGYVLEWLTVYASDPLV
jgi:hypothetical protein